MTDLLVRRASRVFGHESDGPCCVVVGRGRVAGVVSERSLSSETVGRIRADLVGTTGDDAGSVTDDMPELDATGRAVIPGFVDAHTHLVFAGDRADEFASRLAGKPYRAGGIMSTVAATRAASKEELTAGVVERAAKCIHGGTTTIEVKSGYGLDTASELRSLEAVAEASAIIAADLVPTFLGAHLDPEPGYVDLVVNEMLPACAPLAESCDAFCDVELSRSNRREGFSRLARFTASCRASMQKSSPTPEARRSPRKLDARLRIISSTSPPTTQRPSPRPAS